MTGNDQLNQFTLNRNRCRQRDMSSNKAPVFAGAAAVFCRVSHSTKRFVTSSFEAKSVNTCHLTYHFYFVLKYWQWSISFIHSLKKSHNDFLTEVKLFCFAFLEKVLTNKLRCFIFICDTILYDLRYTSDLGGTLLRDITLKILLENKWATCVGYLLSLNVYVPMGQIQ